MNVYFDAQIVSYLAGRNFFQSGSSVLLKRPQHSLNTFFFLTQDSAGSSCVPAPVLPVWEEPEFIILQKGILQPHCSDSPTLRSLLMQEVRDWNLRSN